MPSAAYYAAHPEYRAKEKQRKHDWYVANKETLLPMYREYYHTKVDKVKERERNRIRKSTLEDRAKRGKVGRARHLKLRTEVLAGYGGACVCCGETTPEFLAIDHVNGGGSKQRQAGLKACKLFNFLIKENYPPEFQILCHNCNQAKGFYGQCPHKR